MAVQYFISNKIEKLSECFSENISAKNDVFTPELIITQTKGMERWLSLTLAHNKSVFANYKYLKPDDFFLELLRLLDLDKRYYPPRESVKWKLHALLDDDEFKKQYHEVSSYYYKDAIKRNQLASKLADFFDQYEIYRQDYIEKWNCGAHTCIDDETFKNEFAKHEEWQSWLWHKLKESDDRILDKLELKAELLKKVNDESFKTQIVEQYPRISVFGVSILTDFHSEILTALQEIVDVHFYLLSPSPKTDWYKNGPHLDENAILLSCKKAGQHIFNAIPDSVIPKVEAIQHENDSLLKTIQTDIFNNNNELIKKFEFSQQPDESLQIVASYTPVREVEALYNYLLHIFDKDKNLTSRDVIIQLTDVSLYAPYIKAVFDNGPISIPYEITDVAYTDGDTLTNALESFFNLPFTNFSSESVLKLLSSSFVRKKFDIEDLKLVRDLIKGANIRFGKEGNDNDETYLTSWNHGFNTLVLDYTMNGSSFYTIGGKTYFLRNNVEESNAHTIFRLKAYVDTIFQLHQECVNDRSLADWKTFVFDSLLERLFEVSDEGFEELNYIRSTVSSLDNIDNLNDEEISFQLFQKAVLDDIKHEKRKQNYYTGMLTFSSLIPVRSIPYKVIALLGLNNESFPRKQSRYGFDLMSFESRPGDRNTREGDKYLFLESILAAREKLYLSYIGRDVKDNSVNPPSLLIDELLDYIKIGKQGKKVEESIWVKHPMHGFSNLYGQKNSGLYTYLGDQDIKDKPNKEETFKMDDSDAASHKVNIDQLITFFKNPFKGYYNHTLNIYYGEDEEDEAAPETETFDLNNLEQWQLKKDLFFNKNTNDFELRKKSLGELSLANTGKIQIKEMSDAIQKLKDKFDHVKQNNTQRTIKAELQISNTLLEGQISEIYGNTYIHVNFSKKTSQAKYMIEAWIKHLFLVATGEEFEAQFISIEKDFTFKEIAISTEQAQDRLERLLEIYRLGHQSLIPFSPNTGLELAKKYSAEPENIDDFVDKAIEKLKGEGQTGFNRDYCNAYIEAEIGNGFFENIDIVENKQSLKELAGLLFDQLHNY